MSLPPVSPLSGFRMRRFRLGGKAGFDDAGPEIFAMKSSDEPDANAFWTHGFTLILIATRTKTFSIHGVQHHLHSARAFRLPLRQERQVRYLGRYKQHG